MLTRVSIILVAAMAFGSTACKKDKDKAPPATGSAPAAGSAPMAGSAPAAGSDMAGSAAGSADAGSAAAGSADTGAATPPPADGTEMANKAGNCPSTVFGAVTKAEVKGKEVVITITSEDKDAVLSIQKRADSLLKEKAQGATGATHDQKGTRGGSVGLCPVYFGEGGTALAKKNSKGVSIIVTPKIKTEELKATIDERITKAAAWVDKNIKPGAEGNTGGTGGGKGAHGSTHRGEGDAKGKDRPGGTGGGAGTGGGGGKGTGAGADKKDAPKGS